VQQETIAEINLSALRANYRHLASLAAPAGVIAAVKADAYGHGAVDVSRCLADEGCRMLAVVTLGEALALREAGITQDVLVMGVVDPGRAEQVLAADVVVALHGMAHAAECEAAARAAHGRMRCHIMADTGMHRLGMDFEKTVVLAGRLKDSDSAVVEGLMTHMSHSEQADLDHTELQLANLRRIVAELEARGLRPPMVHAANSATLMRCPDALYDAARPGITLYGINPCREYARDVPLRLAMTLSAPIALVKDVAPGEGVSYGHLWRATVPSRIAALPVGYHDGYTRALSNKGVARVEGRLAPVVGSVCMDTTLIDVTKIPAAHVGSRAMLIEPEADSPLSVYALAELLDTIPHEIVCRITGRARRVYVDEG